MEKMLKHHLDEPIPIERLRPGVPAAVLSAVRRLLAKKPDHRYQQPIQLRRSLKRSRRADRSRPEQQEPRRQRPDAASTTQTHPAPACGAEPGGRGWTGSIGFVSAWRGELLGVCRMAGSRGFGVAGAVLAFAPGKG